MAKSPVIAVEVRYRPLEGGPGDADGAWTYQRFAPGEQIALRNLRRGVAYQVQARNLGVGELASGWTEVSVTVPNSNRTGAAGQLPVAAGNVTSRWVSGTAVNYTSTDTQATVTVTAGVLQIGGKQIAYGASSVVVAGTANEIKKLYLYYDDLYLQGGTRTLGATTSPVASMSSGGRILIAALNVTFAPTGGTVTGGGDIGGGGGGSGGGSGEFNTQPL